VANDDIINQLCLFPELDFSLKLHLLFAGLLSHLTLMTAEILSEIRMLQSEMRLGASQCHLDL
jgi:hypothetical protein